MGRVRTVLVIEDNPDNSAIIEVALGLTTSLTCHFAANGAEAIDRLRERDFDVVLLDPGLPDVGDREIMRAVLERDPAPAVVIVTADARPSSAERYRSLGARAVITKPFDPLTLARDVLIHAGVWAASPSPVRQHPGASGGERKE